MYCVNVCVCVCVCKKYVERKGGAPLHGKKNVKVSYFRTFVCATVLCFPSISFIHVNAVLVRAYGSIVPGLPFGLI